MENQSIPPNGSTLSHTPSHTQSPHYWKTTTITLLIAFAVGVVVWIFNSQIQSPQIASVFNQITPVLLQPSLQPTERVPPLDGTMELYELEQMANWKVFRDSSVGISFKYPPEWGMPKITFRKSLDGSDFLFHVVFPNSPFRVGGTSADFEEGREGSWTDFNGFGHNPNSLFFWDNPQKLCDNKDWLKCDIGQNNEVDFLSGARCVQLASISSFERIKFIDRPTRQITGLAFGGYFLSDKFLENFSTLIPAGHRQSNWCDISTDNMIPAEVKMMNDKVKSKNLDAESLKNLDTFEKVFETIEEI